MRITRILYRRLYSLFRRSRAEADLRREIDLHMDQLTREFIAEGMSATEARLAAHREFGPIDLTKEQCRDMRRINFLDDLYRDLAYSFRVLAKSPGFTLTAILSLALGIGANTLVFSVLNALIIKPLPILEPGRVYSVNNSGQPASSFPNYRDIRDRNSVFESLFAYRIAQIALDDKSSASPAWGFLVTGNYFQTLGIQPALGRFFTPAEDARLNANPYAVLSYSSWQNRFAGDPNLPGKIIRVNGRPYTVLGVAPREFHGTEVFFWPEIWVPLSMQQDIESFAWLESRNASNAWVAGRLKPGVTVNQAEANLQTVAAQLAREYPVNEGMRLTLSKPGIAGSAGREPTRAFASGVMLLASLVLLAACANLAVLLTARAADRERDLAIRVSMGAGRGRLIRQLLTESLCLSIAGGAAGCLLANLLLGLLSQWHAPLDFPIQFDVSPDWRVFSFAFAAAIVTGILFGAGTVLRAWKADPALSLKGITVRTNGRGWAARDILLPVQIALCCVLVTASLVAVRGLMRSFETPLGFQPNGAAVAAYDVGLARYDEPRGRAFEQRALEEVSRLPGVESAAYASSIPLSIDQSTSTVYADSVTDFRPKNAHNATYFYVSRGYLKTVGTKLIAGRDFGPEDNKKTRRIAIVNQTFARRVIGSVDAVGHRFQLGRNSLVEVVGIVEDGKYETLTEDQRAAMFFPIDQAYSNAVVLMARSRRPESEVAGEIRQVLNRLDPHLPVYSVGGLRQMLGLVYLPMRAAVISLGAFGVLALMLSVTGIYGLAGYTVSRRRKEIGIRMAIGARPGQVLRFVFGRIGALITAGAVLGLGLGIAATGIMASIVYQASSRDPVVIVGAVLVISVVALAATFGPARRAIRVDPVQSLRSE